MHTLYWKQCKDVTVRPLQKLRSLRILITKPKLTFEIIINKKSYKSCL